MLPRFYHHLTVQSRASTVLPRLSAKNASSTSYPIPPLKPVGRRAQLEVTKGLVNDVLHAVQDDIPRALPLIGILKNTLESRVLCKLHTDSWPSFNAVVCEIIYPRASQVADLLCYSRGSKDDMLQLLLNNNLISWGKQQHMYHVENPLSDHLCENLLEPSTGRKVFTTSLEAVAAYLPKAVKELPCPEGFVLGQLRIQHTPLVSKYWEKFHSWPREASYIEGLISDFDTKAIYTTDNLDTPVAWVFQYPFGRLGGLYTMKEFRDQDVGTLLTAELSKVVAATGLMPEALTEVRNPASRKITAKLGYIESQYHLKWLFQQ